MRCSLEVNGVQAAEIAGQLCHLLGAEEEGFGLVVGSVRVCVCVCVCDEVYS